MLGISITRLMVHCFSPYPFAPTCFEMELFDGAIMMLCILASLVICTSIRRYNQLKSTCRPDQDMAAMKGWHYAVVMVLTLSLAGLLSAEGFHIRPLRIVWISSLFWEPLSLIPQVILYRRYRQVEAFTEASFLLLMGLYRLVYIADWIVTDNYHHMHQDDFYAPYRFWNDMSCVAQVSIASWALFWQDGANHGRLPTAPTMTQAMHFWRDAYWGICPLLVLFILACRLDLRQAVVEESSEGATYVHDISCPEDWTHYPVQVCFLLLPLSPLPCFCWGFGNDARDIMVHVVDGGELGLLHRDQINQQSKPDSNNYDETTATATFRIPNDAGGITTV